jgi:hypothetical protein
MEIVEDFASGGTGGDQRGGSIERMFLSGAQGKVAR